MEWQAPRKNFYALVAAVFNPELTATQALIMLNVEAPANDETIEANTNHRKAPRRVMPPKEELLKLKEQYTQYGIAEHYKVSQCTISKWMALYNIDCSKRRFEPSKAEIEKAYSDITLDLYEVAEKVGVSVSKLYELMKKHNIPIQGKRKHIKIS